MAKRKGPKEDPPASAPAYMVSFGDMMTIMLTFFILLCSYSTTRMAGFVADGIGSFRNSVNALGMPGLLPGDTKAIDVGARRVRFRPNDALNEEMLTDPDGSISDLNRQALRNSVKDILKTNKATRLPLTWVFDYRQFELSEDHKTSLNEIGDLLQGKNVKLKIEGFAYEEAQDEAEIFACAITRAHNVGRYLSRNFNIPEKNIFPVGNGSGGKGNDMDRRKARRHQDKYGRRIVDIYLVPMNK